ncbi:MAG: hypothetical protein L7F78_15560, partial [Syntrophales bacterium LBB04]|nr:hypothetical protein [Syntrophales bacterium LBB04]
MAGGEVFGSGAYFLTWINSPLAWSWPPGKYQKNSSLLIPTADQGKFLDDPEINQKFWLQVIIGILAALKRFDFLRV